MEISARHALAPLLVCLLSCPTLAAPPPPRAAVFVGVERTGAPDARLGKILRRRLERSGEVVRAPEPPLSPAERACSSVDCLGPLARLQGEKRLWGASVQPGRVGGQDLRVWIYDAPTQRLLESERGCGTCDDQALASAILEVRLTLFEHLGRDEPAAPPPIAPPPALVLLPPPIAPAPAPAPSFWSTGRGRAATAIIPLLAATLSTTIVLSALHGSGQEPCLVTRGEDGTATTRCNGGLVLGLGYGASAALAGGLLLTFMLPRGK